MKKKKQPTVVKQRLIVISLSELSNGEINVKINHGDFDEEYAMGFLGYIHNEYLKHNSQPKSNEQ